MAVAEETITSAFCQDGCGIFLNNEEELKEHQKTCQCKILDCPNCGIRIARRLFLRHTNELCGYRTSECTDCNDSFSIKNLKAHEQSCPYKKPSCEDNRAKVVFKTKELMSPGDPISSESYLFNMNIKGEEPFFSRHKTKDENKLINEHQDKVALEIQDISRRICNLEGFVNGLKSPSNKMDLNARTEYKEIKSKLESLESSFHQCVKDQQVFNAGITERLDACDRKLNENFSLTTSSEHKEKVSRGNEVVLDLANPNEVRFGGITIWNIKHALSKALNKSPEDIKVVHGGYVKKGQEEDDHFLWGKFNGKRHSFIFKYVWHTDFELSLLLETLQNGTWKVVPCLISTESDLVVAYKTSEEPFSTRNKKVFTFLNSQTVLASFCIVKLS